MVVEGIATVCCVFIKYEGSTTARGGSKNSIKGMAKAVKRFYYRNSRGLLTINATSKTLVVNLKGTNQNARKAEKLAKSKYKGFDHLMIVSQYMSNSHAAGGNAYLKSCSFTTACHEFGHLIGLGHSGAYKGMSGKYRPYGDGYSVMSGYGSNDLTVSQYNYLGWLPKSEIGVFEGGSKEYQLKRLDKFSDRGLSCVKYESDGKVYWISWSKHKRKDKDVIFIHKEFSKGRGSSRMDFFTNNGEVKGFTVEKIGDTEGGYVTILVSEK